MGYISYSIIARKLGLEIKTKSWFQNSPMMFKP